MFCLRMPSQMHRKGEGPTTLGTKQGTVSGTAPLERLALRPGEPQHATDRLDSIGRDALSGKCAPSEPPRFPVERTSRRARNRVGLKSCQPIVGAPLRRSRRSDHSPPACKSRRGLKRRPPGPQRRLRAGQQSYGRGPFGIRIRVPWTKWVADHAIGTRSGWKLWA